MKLHNDWGNDLEFEIDSDHGAFMMSMIRIKETVRLLRVDRVRSHTHTHCLTETLINNTKSRVLC